MNQITFSQAVDGYLLHAHSRRLSKHTISDYSNVFRKFTAHWAPHDPSLDSITIENVEEFLASHDHLSQKTILNYHTALSALWTWATRRGIVEKHIPHHIPRPKPEQRVVEVFTEEEIRKLVRGCERSRTVKRAGYKPYSYARPTATRDKTILLVLLDSMVRATELCEMQISLVNLRQGTIKVTGKGKKERVVPISSDTADAIWYYISAARPTPRPRYTDILFLNREGRPLDKDDLGRMIRRLGNRVGVHAHTHKFRHTGATMFISNGGNAFALKHILGHSTMKMVNLYVHIAQADIEEAHRQASPVYNMDLRL